jgi:hypothetical protein
MIAVSPLNPLPHKTTFHELAHVLLGETPTPVRAGSLEVVTDGIGRAFERGGKVLSLSFRR